MAAVVHGVLLCAMAALAMGAGAVLHVAACTVIGVGIWWTSNTVSHNHIHNPVFRARAHNRAFSWYLTLLLGVPQSFWRARHLWHHAGEPSDRFPRFDARGRGELVAVLVAWSALALALPRFFFAAYLPGYLLGMALCWLQGRYEHPVDRNAVSHYGALYNWLWFNDGHHVEHHARPGAHWTELPTLKASAAPASAVPPFLRPFEGLVNRSLGALEELVLGSAWLQRFLVDSHARAFASLLAQLPRVSRVAIVGGGLFPRTVLVLRRMLPDCELVVIDASAENIAIARRHLREHGVDGVDFVEGFFDAARGVVGVDLVVVPLAFEGDRSGLWAASKRTPILVHDWIWRRSTPHSKVISWLLLKRLNLLYAETCRLPAARADAIMTR